MLSNLKLAARLGLGFGIVVVLLLLVSVLSIQRLEAVNANTRLIVEDRYVKVSQMSDTISRTFDNGRQLRNMLLFHGDAEMAQFRQKTDDNRAKNRAGLAKVEALLNTPKGRELFKQITDNYEYGEVPGRTQEINID